MAIARPAVSVITVVENGERFLGEALDSVLSQDYSPYEMIVVDGQSTDRTARIARSYPQVRYVQQTAAGLANARNTGIEAARGELVAFLDHDDLWMPGKLSAHVECMASHPDIQYSVTWMIYFLQPGDALRHGFAEEAFSRPRIGFTPGGLVARKSLFDLIGGFNPDYAIGCDTDWFARARDQGIAMEVIPRTLLHKRAHRSNLSANVAVNRRELCRIVKQSLERRRR